MAVFKNSIKKVFQNSNYVNHPNNTPVMMWDENEITCYLCYYFELCNNISVYLTGWQSMNDGRDLKSPNRCESVVASS